MSEININISKTDMGLNNVDNTSDINKPISTATQTALDGKVDKVTGKGLSQEDYTTTEKNKLASITEIFTTALKSAYDGAVTWISTNGTNILNHLSNTSNPHSVTKTQVGLSNVVNSDTTTTANIIDSLNKRFVTDAQLTVVSNTSGTNSGDQTFIDPRVQSVTSSATVTATSLNDLVKVTAQATGLTLANPTGTFSEGQALMYRIKDNATARSITFDTKFRAIGITLPTTTTISKTTYIGCIYNSTDDKFDVIGTVTQA